VKEVRHVAGTKPALSATPIRVFLVDDHPLLRQGIAERLGEEVDLWVCGQAGSAEEALPAIANAKPEIVVVDISLPGRDGIELTKDITHQHHDVLVLVFSMHDEALYAERALQAGAVGYVMKSASAKTLIQAIRKALAGEIVVDQCLVQRLLAREATAPLASPPSPLERLSDRELEVLNLLGNGRLRREIAQQLRLSVKTVESHQSHMREKLGLSTNHQLSQLAAEFFFAEAAELPKKAPLTQRIAPAGGGPRHQPT
jgi:DNA-binding NarL/FixJ family response regulator